MAKIACVAVVKNEARHIAEWLNYQFALGFDTVLLLDNMSVDATKDAAMAGAAGRDLRLLDWPLTGQDYQIRGYEFAALHLEDEFEWIAFFDTDEFLVLDDGLALKLCLAARGDAAAIAVPWALFGSSGHRDMPAAPVTEAFVHRSLPSFGPNQHVKSIVRAKALRGVETPHSFVVDGPYRDLAGREVQWQAKGLLAGAPDYLMGKLHHYFTRSWAHWQEKMRRGYHDVERAMGEFELYDRNEVFDDSAARFMRRRSAGGRRLVIATHNAGKLAEFAQLLAPFGWDAVSAGELGLAEPAETGGSFAENAQIKARAAAARTGLPALADDSGLCVVALGGAPGVLSARYAAGDYAAACVRIIAAADGHREWRARFVCALCLAQPDGETGGATLATYIGQADGRIASMPRGAGGFGYDPIFIPNGFHQTYAELGAARKDRISHRAQAFAQLEAYWRSIVPAS